MASPELPELLVDDVHAWHDWLLANHATSDGVWLVLHKKGGDVTTLTYADALDEALCSGWIDGQVAKRDDGSYVQRMTPRRTGSRWSARNVERAERLREEGRMRPEGQAAIDAAVANGEWARAYAGSASASVPHDLQQAIDAVPAAARTFSTASAANRYAVIYRVEATKTAKGRAQCIERLVAKMATGELPHPQG